MEFAIVFGLLFAFLCTASYLVLDAMGRKAKAYVDNLPTEASQYPALTLIKPVFGADDNTEKTFRSWLDQDYPDEVQFIFSLQNAEDPALTILEKLKTEYEFEVTVNPVQAGFSGKMSNLIHGLEQAEHDVLVFSDADLLAPPDTLKKLGAIAAGGIDIAGCFPLLIGARNVWADIFSFTWNQILTQVVGPSIIRKDPHGLAGATILVKRQALERLGGLTQFRDIIAEDFAMGRAAKEKGLNIGLGPGIFAPTGKMRFIELYSKLQRSHLVGITMNPQGLPSVVLWYLINYGYLFLFLGNLTYQMTALLLAAVRAIYLGRLNTIAEGRFRIPWSFVIGDLIAVASFVLSWFKRTVRWGDGLYRVTRGGKMVLLSRSTRRP